MIKQEIMDLKERVSLLEELIELRKRVEEIEDSIVAKPYIVYPYYPYYTYPQITDTPWYEVNKVYCTDYPENVSNKTITMNPMQLYKNATKTDGSLLSK